MVVMSAQPQILRGSVPSGFDDGYGYGYGDGYGYGSVLGSGSGYGDGYGYGSVFGDGDADGDGSYWRSTISWFANRWSGEQQSRLRDAEQAGATIAFWRSNAKALPANGGGKIEPAAPGVIHTVPGPLNPCSPRALHATLIPPQWRGERWWIVALHGEVVGDDEKYGCLKREILGEAL